MILTTIISGGQTGVDQVALQVAYELGYRTGGTAPLYYRTDAGNNPQLLKDLYGLKESAFRGYRVRTIANVRDADATVWFGEHDSPGRRLTVTHATRRPGALFVSNPTAVILRNWLNAFDIRILNVAGHRLATHPEAAAYAGACLALALDDHSAAPLR